MASNKNSIKDAATSSKTNVNPVSTLPQSPKKVEEKNPNETKNEDETKTETVNDTKIETESETKDLTEAEKKKQEKREKMRQKAEMAVNAIADPLKKMELFDSTKASAMETKGTSSLGSVKVEKNAALIMGRNVGAEQNEPDWTKEQMSYITTMTETILPIQGVTDTRRSVPDPQMEFVGRDKDGSIMPTEKAYLSNLDPNVYCIGTGPAKYDITGSPKYYMDAVIADREGKWLLSQWTSEWIVVEGVAPEVLMKQNRNGASLKSERRIGVHFARIGLPKMAFGPLFNSLSQVYRGIMSNIIETKGYYWTNASWGVSSFAATFAHMDEGELRKTSNLAEVMRMLGGKSALTLATVAISITCPSKSDGNKQVMDMSSYSLSLKLHNAFAIDIVDYHGPPQQGSTGMMIPNRLLSSAKSMGGSTSVNGGMSIFSSSKAGLFNTTTQPALSAKSNDNVSYM